MNLVGFIIRIYHDARSPERQNIFNIGNLSGFKILKYSYCKIVKCTIRLCTNKIALKFTQIKQHIKMIVLF